MMGITPPVHLIDPQPGVEPVNALEAGAFSSGSCVESNPAFLLSWARVDAPEPFWYGNRPRWAMRGGATHQPGMLVGSFRKAKRKRPENVKFLYIYTGGGIGEIEFNAT